MATAKTELSQKRAIDARQAYKAAVDYFNGLFRTVIEPSLEEVELSDNGKYWLITLGFEEKTPNLLGHIKPPKTKFKIFKVDATTGVVVAMKMRSLE